jgi:hypothetical protein
LLLLVAIFGFRYSFASIDSNAGLVEQKNFLASRLDSLEVEKQLKKRLGQDLSGLEQEASAIRDSIDSIRNSFVALPAKKDTSGINSGNQVKPLPPTYMPGLKKYGIMLITVFKPKTRIDWIIFSIAGVAVFSGILLFWGIIASAASRRRRRRLTPGYVVPTQKKMSGIREPAKDTSIDKENEFKKLSAFDSDSGSGSEKTHGKDEPADAETIRAMVIKAAKEGLDEREIARRYHLSVDQVALIIRMARMSN